MRPFFLPLTLVFSACASTDGGQTGEEQRQRDSGAKDSTPSADSAPTAPPDGAPGPFDAKADASGSPCTRGFSRATSGETRECAISVGELCFTNTDDACACAGCPGAGCMTAASDPPQAVCEGSASGDAACEGYDPYRCTDGGVTEMMDPCGTPRWVLVHRCSAGCRTDLPPWSPSSTVPSVGSAPEMCAEHLDGGS